MFEQKSAKETILELHSSAGNGLSEAEARKRLEQNGKNELKEGKKKSVAEAFFEQLNDPLIYVLLVAVIISLLLHEVSDAMIILVVVTVNAVVGVIREGKAQKALEALKGLTIPKAIVKREGRKREVLSSELVVGDIVYLDAGRQIPADLRLLETVSMKVEESALTGESLPVEKDALFQANQTCPVGDRKNMAYMSTVVTYGRGTGIVTAVGMDTEIGKIAAMIDEAPQELTPLQKRLGDLGKLLSIVAVVLCAALFAIAVIQKRDIADMLITAISLAVAAVPEGLPAVVTIVLALSVSKMVKVHTIVRKLPSVETLGAVGVVCSDKTGTLTQNKMSVTACYVDQHMCDAGEADARKNREFLECCVLCNDAAVSETERIGDPTELALVDFAEAHHLNRKELQTDMPRIDEVSFDSKRKMMTTLHQSRHGKISYTKGAADRVISKCTHILINQKRIPLTDIHKRQIMIAMEEMSAQALRVLAIAMCPNVTMPKEEGLTFLGLTGMIDPARPEAKEAVRTFREASVDTIMITGDHVDTAFAIAKQLGIANKMSECMTGEELERLSAGELQRKLRQTKVFARVAPEHKVQIIKGLKASGKIVAMTGDGVNDAPSLKAADIGIAMGETGTDVAKNASDMILTDDNFATIEKAIEEGRGIYENIRKSILFLLSSNFGEIITMFLSILCGLASPLKASHILWINLITDSLPALALGVDENDKKSLMRRPPRKVQESLFANGGLSCTLFYGVLIAGISLTAFLKLPLEVLTERNAVVSLENLIIVLKSPEILNRAQTYAFTVLGLSQLFHAVGMRDVHKSVFCMDHSANKLMIAAFFAGFGLQILVTEIPYMVEIFGTAALTMGEWIQLIILSAFPLIAHEIMVLFSVGTVFDHRRENVVSY